MAIVLNSISLNSINAILEIVVRSASPVRFVVLEPRVYLLKELNEKTTICEVLISNFSGVESNVSKGTGM